MWKHLFNYHLKLLHYNKANVTGLWSLSGLGAVFFDNDIVISFTGICRIWHFYMMAVGWENENATKVNKNPTLQGQ